MDPNMKLQPNQGDAHLDPSQIKRLVEKLNYQTL
jgi:hypothetical protein